MSVWSKIIELATNDFDIIGRNDSHRISDFPTYAVFDLEVGMEDYKIHDIGAIRHDEAIFHKASKRDFFGFIKNVDFLCGHNIINHDVKYLFGEGNCRWQLVDTLYLSPLLFPESPYHKLVKDDKLIVE